MTFDVTALMDSIGSMGFPIAMCIYLITTLNKTLDANTKATEKLVTLVGTLVNKKDSDAV